MPALHEGACWCTSINSTCWFKLACNLVPERTHTARNTCKLTKKQTNNKAASHRAQTRARLSDASTRAIILTDSDIHAGSTHTQETWWHALKKKTSGCSLTEELVPERRLLRKQEKQWQEYSKTP